ncbi:MAG TPA: AMP-binding protein [Jatrophihabitantaceae bacterium]|nr:AMP-binding protein [Jatrophihabitantaceae bacterium]
MFGSTVAQLRYATAIARGRAVPPWVLRSLVGAALRTAEHRGVRATSVDALLTDDAASLDLTRRRFARQVHYACSRTRAYCTIPSSYGDHRTLPDSGDGLPNFSELPVTTKADISARPGEFVAAGVAAAAVTFTTGSSGPPLPIVFERTELKTSFMLSALGNVVFGHVTAQDRVLVAHGTRIGLSNSCVALAAGYIGAQVTIAAQPSPSRLIEMMAATPEPPTVLYVHPSYLGHLVTLIQRGGMSAPAGLRRIMIGGELVTAGLVARARVVFGPDVDFVQGYGMTETWPAAGSMCEAGHMHVEPARAIVEVKALDGARHAGVGELGTLVVTPLLPFRVATPLIRYDTGDLVRAVQQPTACSMAGLPATSSPLGRLGAAVRLPGRVITPREILEVVEADPHVPLPSRIGYRRVGSRVAVDVQVFAVSVAARHALGAAFDAAGIPLESLTLYGIDDTLPCSTYPWRGDLWEPELRGGFAPDRAS